MTTMSWVMKLGDWLSGSSCGRSKLPSIRLIKPSQWLSIQRGPCLGLFVHFTQGLSAKTKIELQNDLRLKKSLWDLPTGTWGPVLFLHQLPEISTLSGPILLLPEQSCNFPPISNSGAQVEFSQPAWLLKVTSVAAWTSKVLQASKAGGKSRLPSLPLPNVTWNA
jgi:hypothetical protein